MKLNQNRSRCLLRSNITTALFAIAFGACASLASVDAADAQGAAAPDAAEQPTINLPDPVKRMLGGQAAPQGQAPVVVPPITFVDVNSGRFGKLEIDLEAAQFLDGSADHLHLIARDLDVREGVLKSLDLNVTGGHLRDFIVDHFTLTTQGSMRFDSGVLINQKVLQFVEPTVADVTADISQESLNKFINAPSTIDRLSAQVGKRAGALAGLFGGKAPGLTVSNGQLVLAKGNHVNLKFDAKVGIGEMGVPMPIEVDSVLALKDGWVHVTDSKLLTSGQEISPAISQWLVKKINELSQFGALSDDIHFRFTELKMKPGKGFFLKGTAEVNRLRFGTK
ncbi:MAG: hypothetical protein SGJ27_13370 [Candidatus Melainabacteria bacterium]|nr:hypothetical protein [Candidatus Melainabacteria bacterium]